jgi:integrase
MATFLRRGKRGDVWSIRYRDASGAIVRERLGRADEGWTRRKAEAAERARKVEVDKGYAKPERVTFADFADEWIGDYPEARSLKRSTIEGYEQLLRRHLLPAFGTLALSAITTERAERLVARMRGGGLSPATCNRALNLLSLILGDAKRQKLVTENVVAAVRRPREGRTRWTILDPAKVRAVERAFDALIAEADTEAERAWRETCRVTFLVVYGLGLRRGEVLGLRWRNVRLADPDGPTVRVDETFLRGRYGLPKSARSIRTLAIGPRLAEVLFVHRAASAYSGDDELVVPNPRTGTPLEPATYGATFKLALARAGVEGYVRPFHDGRHSAITNGAAAGLSPAALMARAGHSSMNTTLRYIDLAGETFRDEAELLERRLFGTGEAEKKPKFADAASSEEAA